MGARLDAETLMGQARERAGLSGRWITPTRGTHILVPRHRLPTDGAVIFPSRVDGRVMFLIPWPRYPVVGTTDLDADPTRPVRATREEVEYLLDYFNQFVDSPVVNGVFQGRKQAEIAGKPYNVPRIDEGSALDSSMDEFFTLC